MRIVHDTIERLVALADHAGLLTFARRDEATQRLPDGAIFLWVPWLPRLDSKQKPPE